MSALKKAQQALAERRAVGTPNLTPIEKAQANPKSLRAAINAKCWDCCCGMREEVRNCTAYDCPLHGLRPWQPKVIDARTVLYCDNFVCGSNEEKRCMAVGECQEYVKPDNKQGEGK